jgi:hypothetical protein
VSFKTNQEIFSVDLLAESDETKQLYVDISFAVLPCLAVWVQDDAGLIEFYQDYFTFPLYRDENIFFHRAFGGGKITDNMSWWSLFKPWRARPVALGRVLVQP